VGVLSVLRIAGSALTAERLRMDVTSSNIANADSTKSVDGQPYRKSRAVFAPMGPTTPQMGSRSGSSSAATQGGVQVRGIVQDEQPARRVYDPAHPDSDTDGYVSYPNVDLATEMTDMLEASRAYEANVTVINVAKNMAQRALDIGRA
jgi:flagellar basal-body rod protein FlgC